MWDNFGLPLMDGTATASDKINALPFRAYQEIYNTYFRSQDLCDKVIFPKTSGQVGSSAAGELTKTRYRSWERDYFTSCLPEAQKGGEVLLPMEADIVYKQWSDVVGEAGNSGTLQSTNQSTENLRVGGTTYKARIENIDTIENASTTINELRNAVRLQEWLEKNARGGTRYIENILTHFGVRSSDKRLQRPEYITGVKSPVVVSEVLNTTGQDGGLPQGNMSGHGISVTSGKSGSYYCEEHGYIIGIMSVMPKTAYQQGIPRTFLKTDSLDYFWPTFANIGEQEVAKQELYAYTANKEETFGYVPRYAEYKYMPSRVAGEFRTSLNYWHLGRIFATEPSLNSDFIECDPTKRIFAVEDPATDVLYCHVLNKIKAVRPMPKYGTPAGL